MQIFDSITLLETPK